MRKYLFVLLALSFLQATCGRQTTYKEVAPATLVFKHGKIFGNPGPLQELIREYEHLHPGIRVIDETLPSSTDEQHQFYAINLEGKSSDFDVLAMDVIWVPEFARAGWLMELGSNAIPLNRRSDFFEGPMQAVTWQNRIYAVPWYIDAGLLYYRQDLLQKHGYPAPRTWHDLRETAQEIQRREPAIYGFLWQGKQYEGLVCNILEYLWANGGDVIRNEEVVIESAENEEALQFVQDLVHRYGISPPFITNSVEDSTREIFGSGRAVFMRNWPYAWTLFQRSGSAVKDKVGVTLLPAFAGHDSASTLGGWQLGVNRFSMRPGDAEEFISFLTSPQAQKRLAMDTGYQPTLKSVYSDPELIQKQPFVAGLYDVFENARPRPVTPYYMMISQVLQPEFSAVVSRIKRPGDALRSAGRQIRFLLQSEEPPAANRQTAQKIFWQRGNPL